MYAEAPDTIFSRRSRYRYGLKVSRDFAPGLRQDLKYTDATTGKDYCSDCFDSLIELDQLVEHNQVGWANLFLHSLRAFLILLPQNAALKVITVILAFHGCP